MIYRFGDCSIDTTHHRFLRGAEAVHLEPQVFDLLLLLARNPGELLSKERLIEEIWAGLNVSDSTISARISLARAAVGDNGKAQAVIRTVPRRGVQLVVPVEQDGGAAISTTGARPDVRFARSRDGQGIAYAVSGDGPPLLRAGHWLTHLELDWGSEVWRPLLTTLSRNHRLVRYDQRGTGLSDRTLENCDLDAFIDDLEAVADAAGLDRFPIYAASQAVPIALGFAARAPDRVSRIVAHGGYAVGRMHREPAAGDVDPDTMRALLTSGWGVHGSTFAKSFVSLFMPTATPEQVADIISLQQRSVDADAAVRLRQAVDSFDVRGLLEQVRCPVLIIHSSGDVIHPISQGRLLARGLPDARFAMLDSDNHIIMEQDPAWDVLIGEIEAFLDEERAP